MKFFYTLTKSLSSKPFYGEVVGGKHPTGFMFLAKIQVLVSLFITIIISIQVSSALPLLQQKAAVLLPEGAEIVLKDGILQSNINPILIPFSNEVLTNISDESGQLVGSGGDTKLPSNFAVLDTLASTTEEGLTSRDTFMLITRDGIVSGTAGGRVSMNYFSEIKGLSLVIDREFLVSKAEMLKQVAKFMPFILFVGLWIILYVMGLFTSLMYAVFVFIMFKIMKTNKGFREAFAVAIYSRGFALMLGVIGLILPLLMIPTLSILIQLLFIVLMIRPARLENNII